ncbi:class C sortase [Glutamicibacter bergerei]|uniref:Class C sortase n=1 Tax=Glutamicibacter bergerei TaxID=256702 RepID=A0ABV9MKU3_9MICC
MLDPNDDGLMARLRIPSIDVKVPVYHGTAEDVLLEGAGHLEGTALPVGGVGTHAVMTGHRELPQAAMFTDLDKVEPGDMIEIDVYGQTLVYRVTDSSVVLPTETALLRPQTGVDLISLVTCTPLGVNSHRIIVTAERVNPTPPSAGKNVDSVGFPWWAVGLTATAVAGIWYVMRTRGQSDASSR